jgi:hypothetical protein
MNMTEMNPDVARAVRAELVSIGTRGSGLQKHQRRSRALAFSIVAVAIAGATTGAAIVANLPGTTTVDPLGGAVTAMHSGTATIDLGPAAGGSNSVILDLSCISVTGKISVPLTPGVAQDSSGATTPGGAETVEFDCGAGSRTVHIDDGLLNPGGTSITITADPGTTWTAVAQYGTATTTDWGVNANGQTYGADNKKNGMPDLQSAQATNGAVGYIFTEELYAFQGSGYLNVYESDGVTVLGKFPIGDVDGNSYTVISDPPTP